MKWTVIAASVLLSASAHANPYMTEIIGAKAVGGCKVEINISIIKGVATQGEVRRAREIYAFDRESCSVQTSTLQSQEWTVDKAISPEDARKMGYMGTPHQYQHSKVVDEVCGDGEWVYELISPESLKHSDYIQRSNVTVTGCKPTTPCTANLDAPKRVHLTRPTYDMGWSMMTTVGETRDIEVLFGEPISGADNVAVEEKGGQSYVRGLLPGVARFHQKGKDEKSVITVTVKPNKYKSYTMDDKKRWAFREFSQTGADEQIVMMKKGEPWLVPVEGTLKRGETGENDIKVTVDEMCRTVINPLRIAREDSYEGIEVKEPSGKRHLYFLNLAETDPALPCRLVQRRELAVGEHLQLDEGVEFIEGASLLDKKSGNTTALKGGHAIWKLPKKPNECGEAVIAGLPEGHEAKLAWADKKFGGTKVDVIFLTMKVGEIKKLDFHAISTNGTTDNAELDIRRAKLRVAAKSVGLSAVLVVDDRGNEHRIIIDTTGTP